jgi:VWFA-related protein
MRGIHSSRYTARLYKITEVAAAVFLAGSLPTAFLLAQNRQQKPLRHDAAAVIKLVSVRVLDTSGRPVTDLKKDDFAVTDNGEPKPITEFEVHNLISPEKVTENIPLSAGEKEPPETGRRFFIVFDVQSSDANGIVNAKKAALHFVNTQMRPGDEAGVLYYAAMTGLNMVEYLTQDKEKIKKAIKRANEAPPSAGFPFGVGDDAGRVISRHRTTGTAGKASGAAVAASAQSGAAGASQNLPVSDQSGGSEGRLEADAIGERGNIEYAPGLAIMGRNQRDYVTDMAEIAKAMEVVPGTKNIVLFTARNISKETGREFATANTPVFTINTRDWIVRSAGGASIKEKHIWTDHPLKEFAQATGGKYFADIKDINAIAEEIQTLTGCYYVIGYYISETWDGRYHEISVRVKRPGCRVFVQAGYYNPRPFSQLTDIEKRLQLFDLAFGDKPALQDAFEIPLELLLLRGHPQTNFLALGKIAVDEKTGLPPVKVEAFIFFSGDNLEAMEARRMEIDLSPYSEKALYPYAAAFLKPGHYEVRLVARDLETGQGAVGRASFEIPAPESPSPLSLSSPMLFVSGGEPQFLKILLKKGPPEKNRSIINFYPLLPQGHSPLLKGLKAGAVKLLAVLPVHFNVEMAQDIDLEVRWQRVPGGEKVLLESRIMTVKDIDEKNAVVMLEVGIPDAPPGSYELEFAAVESETGGVTVARKPLSIK